MTIALAATWNPRGELSRFRNLLPRFQTFYQGMAIVIPPRADVAQVEAIQSLAGRDGYNLTVTRSPDWDIGRILSLECALPFETSHVQYGDMDRMIRWLETYPDECRAALDRIQEVDCLIIGRDAEDYATHPQALLRTEAISNLVASYLLGTQMDVSAGAKGFSQRAVQFLLANAQRRQALGADAEWPVLVQRGGFEVSYLEVRGLDWESADRYQARAAGRERQRELAGEYDRDPEHWAQRVGIAYEIVESGLEAAHRPLVLKQEK